MLKAIIVDDEDLFRKNLKQKIDWDAYRLQLEGEASNGQEALSLIARTRPNIIICDIKMPIMDGLELLKRIQDQPHIKFIILSGYSDFQFIRTAIKYGAFDYILKPIQPEELAGVLLRAVEDIEAARQQAKKEIDLSLDIREKLLGKYESLYIHLVESRDLEGIYQSIDTFYAELEEYPAPHLYQNSVREFIYLLNKICDTFRIDKAIISQKASGRSLEAGGYFQKEMVVQRIKEIFKAIIDDLAYQKNVDRKKIVYNVISDIEKNYFGKISLELISKKYYINPSYFSQLFKSVTNETFSNYVIKYRIQKAKELMKIGGLKIYQIAEMVGYEDEKHFSQLFKKNTGVSPSEYQKIHSISSGGLNETN